MDSLNSWQKSATYDDDSDDISCNKHLLKNGNKMYFTSLLYVQTKYTQSIFFTIKFNSQYFDESLIDVQKSGSEVNYKQLMGNNKCYLLRKILNVKYGITKITLDVNLLGRA